MIWKFSTNGLLPIELYFGFILTKFIDSFFLDGLWSAGIYVLSYTGMLLAISAMRGLADSTKFETFLKLGKSSEI